LEIGKAEQQHLRYFITVAEEGCLKRDIAFLRRERRPTSNTKLGAKEPRVVLLPSDQPRRKRKELSKKSAPRGAPWSSAWRRWPTGAPSQRKAAPSVSLSSTTRTRYSAASRRFPSPARAAKSRCIISGARWTAGHAHARSAAIAHRNPRHRQSSDRSGADGNAAGSARHQQCLCGLDGQATTRNADDARARQGSAGLTAIAASLCATRRTLQRTRCFVISVNTQHIGGVLCEDRHPFRRRPRCRSAPPSSALPDIRALKSSTLERNSFRIGDLFALL
jgi:hypothetical protein